MNKLRNDGHFGKLRGIPFAQATTTPDRFLMMSYNHLTAAIYGAHAEWPDNLQIRKAVSDGFMNCTVFKRVMPSDALEYFISDKRLWNDHAEHNNITSSLYGYTGPNGMPAQEWEFVKKRTQQLSDADKYSSESHYIHSKQVVEFCVKFDLG